MININSKQRAYLRSLAHPIEPILHIGKNGLTPEIIQAVDEAIEKRELIKVNLLKTVLRIQKRLVLCFLKEHVHYLYK